MIEVVHAFDRTALKTLVPDSLVTLDSKLELARKRFHDRSGWLPAWQRIQILQKLAQLMESEKERLAQLIAREGGKPYTDALIETLHAIDGVKNAAETLMNYGGKEIPMGLTDATAHRRAFTIKEPIGVVAAISAFNHG